jgi:predicted transcriptional regulator
MPRVNVPAPNRSKMGNDYAQLSIIIDPEAIREIDRLANLLSGNRSSITRQAIQEFIERNK